jgi:hypothetical protein
VASGKVCDFENRSRCSDDTVPVLHRPDTIRRTSTASFILAEKKTYTLGRGRSERARQGTVRERENAKYHAARADFARELTQRAISSIINLFLGRGCESNGIREGPSVLVLLGRAVLDLTSRAIVNAADGYAERDAVGLGAIE